MSTEPSQTGSVLRVKKLHQDAILPERKSEMAAGYDLASVQPCIVPAKGKCIVRTGLSFAVPGGTYGRIAPRSSLAWKHFIDVGAGVVDQDFRGEVGVILFNHSDVDLCINKRDCVAQLIIEKIDYPKVVEVHDLEDTERGSKGFGSTNKTSSVSEGFTLDDMTAK